jgi:hypothetical protein
MNNMGPRLKKGMATGPRLVRRHPIVENQNTKWQAPKIMSDDDDEDELLHEFGQESKSTLQKEPFSTIRVPLYQPKEWRAKANETQKLKTPLLLLVVDVPCQKLKNAAWSKALATGEIIISPIKVLDCEESQNENKPSYTPSRK